MAATEQSRTTLNKLFSDGERPTGEDFASAWKSFLHKTDDGLSFDGKNLVISSNTGITLGNPTGGPGGKPGTLRFNGTCVQYYDPVINDFRDIAGAAGAFLPVGAGPAVAFSGGNVGIGTTSTVPTHRLEIPLNDHSDTGQEVLLGNLVIHTGPAAKTGAYIGNNLLATIPTGYALFQDRVGKTKINARNALNSQLSLAIEDIDKLIITRVGDIQLSPTTNITMNGDVNIGDIVIGRTVTITNLTTGGTGSPALLVKGDNSGSPTATPALVVNGAAAKTGSLVWVPPASDERIKKEIRPYMEGLDKIIQLKPVVYKYNGKAGIGNNGADNVGLIAQDIQKVAPEMVFIRMAKLNPEDEKETELLNYDFHNILFMFINAFKELANRVEKLEKSLTNAK